MPNFVSIGLTVEEVAWLKHFENIGARSCFSSCVTFDIFGGIYDLLVVN